MLNDAALNYTAPQAGEETALQVITLERDLSQAVVSPKGEVKMHLSMKGQTTSKGLKAVWQKTFAEEM